MLDGQHRLPARLPARASSPRRLWPPCPLRQPPVDPFQQIAELRRRDRHGSIRVLARCRRRPHEPATLQPLGKQAQALSVVPQNLDQSAAAAAEYEQVAGVGVALERLLHQQRQAIKAFAHIGMAARQPNLPPGGEWHHRPPPPLASAATVALRAAGSAPMMRIRDPFANSISINPAAITVVGAAAEIGSDPIRTEANVAASRDPRTSCRRHPYSWLG